MCLACGPHECNLKATMVRTQRPNNNKGIAHKETFLRINYMYQAAHLVLTQSPSNTELIRFYAYTLKAMAKKQVLRLHPNIKRTICKKCYMLLVPGVTATVRKKGKKQEHMVVKCVECQTPKRFPTRADYKLWAEQPQAWFSMFPPEAPLPDNSNNSSADSSEAAPPSSETAKPGCAHRRCRQFPRCRKELKKLASAAESAGPEAVNAGGGNLAGVTHQERVKCSHTSEFDIASYRDITSPIETERQNGNLGVVGNVNNSSNTEHTLSPTLATEDNAGQSARLEIIDCDIDCDDDNDNKFRSKALKRGPITCFEIEVPNSKRQRPEDPLVKGCPR